MSVEIAPAFLRTLFDPSGFMPRRICGRWTTELILLHNLSDALTGLSYFAIPLILAYLTRRLDRSDVPFRAIPWLFGAFIFACGTTHVLEIVVFYSPVYRLVGAVKLFTGLISFITVIALIGVVPRALALRSRLSLEHELEERRRAEAAARARARQLETLVELSRTGLTAADPDALAMLASEAAALGLEVDICGVFRPTPGRVGLRLRAGVGWQGGDVGIATVSPALAPLLALIARQPGVEVGAHPLPEDDGRLEAALLGHDGEAIGCMMLELDGEAAPQGVLLVCMSRPEPFVLLAYAADRRFGEDEAAYLRSVAGLLGSNFGRIEAERALTRLAVTDGLTGLHNARYLREALTLPSPHASRASDGRSAIMLDVDHFKSFNDSLGHPAGDEVLCQVGSILNREARAEDLVARYGGEEFAVILPGVEADEARAVAERIRRAIASHPWPLRPVTASLGVATNGPGGPTAMDLLGEADQALYLAKRTGRNRVVHHDDLKLVGCDGPHAGRAQAGPIAAGPIGPIAAGSRLLHIDDDADYSRMLGRLLAPAGLAVTAAESAAEGARLATGGYDLILLDIRLPDGDGLDLCRRFKADPATAMTPILLLAGKLIRGEDRAVALAAGASAALPKLADAEELLAVISALLRAGQCERELVRERLAVGERLRDQAAELGRACDDTIEGLARVMELRDHETEGHSRRVAELTLRIARRMGLRDRELVYLRRGALLHDIGKVGMPDAILNKPGPLDEAERAEMRRHPEHALHLLRPIEFLRGSLEIPHRHHERWDGGGYPDGLRGEEIPLAARIFAAADIHDALSHDRPYRKAWPADRVRDYIRSLSGTHLDPDVVDAIRVLI